MVEHVSKHDELSGTAQEGKIGGFAPRDAKPWCSKMTRRRQPRWTYSRGHIDP